MAEIKLVIEQTEEQPGVFVSKHICPPHIWYYANMIMHWRCSYCGKLEHEEPKDGLRTNEVEYKRITLPEE